ncbi:unnamed protein product [Somion occarium]|uniref:Eisosome component PIL1-domain-containing protein n=1 Tax=Somion occarium TaxID=3059160 RepID=A0ABP1CL56_9APHY
MSSFFSSIANKAQSALNNTPLAQHIPGSSHGAGTSGESGGSGGSNRYSHTLESIHHQLRTFQQQYSSSTTPAQKIITTQKGVALDLDNVSRDAQANSKEIYLWGQQETDDLKDVTDRIAWLNYVQGQIASALATQLDAARAPFKVLRDAETAIQPRRTLRNNLENQIAKLEHENSKAATQRISEIKTQLHKAQVDDHEAEKEIDILKRKVPSVLPTVAETGVPKSAGPDGPGPASGSLLDIKSDRTPPTPVYGAAIPTSAVGYETAEEEKKRLEREERERLLRTGGSAPPTSASAGAGDATKYESAEEEKKKLERAERERVLREGGSGGGKGPDNHGPPPPGEGEGELPPYQEF